MGIINSIKRWFGMIFSNKAKEEFDVKSITSQAMDRYVDNCLNIYHGKPNWLDEENHIKTVNFAKFICSETAKLSTLGMTVVIDGDSDRVKAIQKQVDEAKANVRQFVEYAGACGTVILKPNGKTVDVVMPGNYIVTDTNNGKIVGVVFVNRDISDNGKKFYTRLEYHRFINDLYVISNKCYVGDTENDHGKPISIEKTPWRGLSEEIGIEKLDTPLFGVLTMPGANSIDVDSPVGMPIFADAIEELKDLDIAYSRNVKEIYDSKRMVLLDADRLIPMGGKFYQTPEGRRALLNKMGLPDYVNTLDGTGDGDIYHEINPALNTQTRMEGINALLSQIGFKCGFSNGYFVFNQSTGFTTATQVTADQARTIQLIEDIRKRIDACLIDVIKAINVFEDLYGTTGHLDIPDTVSTDELDRIIHIHFEPIYTNKEEDRQRALQLTNSGYYPKWYYLHMFEGLSEEDAKALTEEAQPKDGGLFTE